MQQNAKLTPSIIKYRGSSINTTAISAILSITRFWYDSIELGIKKSHYHTIVRSFRGKSLSTISCEKSTLIEY